MATTWIGKRIFVALTLLVAVPCTGLPECLDPSPTVAAGKDPYGAITVRELTGDEHKTIKALFKSLDGQWQGSASALQCRDLKDPQRNKRYLYTVKAEVEVDYFGNFFLQKTLYSRERQTTHQEILRLYLADSHLRINSASTSGNVELIDVEKNRISFLYRLLLQSAAAGGSIRKEIFVVLTAGEQSFEIEQRTYSQGRLSDEQTWRFSRP